MPLHSHLYCRCNIGQVAINIFLFLGITGTCVALFSPAWRVYDGGCQTISNTNVTTDNQPNCQNVPSLGDGLVFYQYVENFTKVVTVEKSLTGNTPTYNRSIAAMYGISIPIIAIVLLLSCVVWSRAADDALAAWTQLLGLVLVFCGFAMQVVSLSIYISQWYEPCGPLYSPGVDAIAKEKYIKTSSIFSFGYAVYVASATAVCIGISLAFGVSELMRLSSIVGQARWKSKGRKSGGRKEGRSRSRMETRSGSRRRRERW